MIDHVQKYIDEVENGNILVCEKIQMAIDRHKKDIERSKRDDFPYYYEPKYTQNIVKFTNKDFEPLYVHLKKW